MQRISALLALLISGVFAAKGLIASFVDLRDETALRQAITPATKGIWIESTNPLVNLVDHSDVVGGALMTADATLGDKLAYLQNALGTVSSPGDCSLVLRGLRTLAIRMEEHNRNALTIAQWLEAHPKIAQVLHPGLPSHPQHALALQQTSGFGGTFSFRLKGAREEAFRFLNAVRLFTLAEFLGGVESLIEHPRTMTHLSIPPETLDRMGIGEDLIRISVGIEDVTDLIADLDQALTTPPG